MALFVGRIPREMNNRDLEDAFSKYGKITRLDVKKGNVFSPSNTAGIVCILTGMVHVGFGFVEYDDKRDAEDAIKGINERGDLVVEWAKNGGKRPGENECFHCGKEGHWARDCLEGGRDAGRDAGRGGGRGGMGGGRGGGGFGRDRSPRRDGGRGNDRDRRDNRGYERRRDDRDERGGRDRSPRRNDYRERGDRGDRGFDRRGGGGGGGDRRDDRGDRREYVPREDRRREDERMAPERNQLE
ncbi:alteRNAtive splicing factor SRp20/9G8 [Mucor ambiguus]|uniref:AlteRNAtive splicing factor SRp20/9G8 n=1 Tax=Mucor ambiguus TaxID=91626 RepID=A0A0C9M4D4_9FUNG|nr:alteRNAtive splicing factor SRp20/9G8 [Mucor ambiguus]